MLLKFSLRTILILVLLSTASIVYAQPGAKALEALEEKNYDRAISLMRKDYFKGQEELAYHIGEAYRKSFDFRQANEWHMRAISSGTEISFYGYCMTMIQQGRLNECLKYAKQKLLLNPNDDELPEIIETCRRLLNPGRRMDSIQILKNASLEELFPVERKASHDPGIIKSETRPAYMISSIYSEQLPDENILRQNKTSIPRVDQIREMEGLGLKYKDDMIGVYTMQDKRDVSYFVFPDYFEEYKNGAHYSGVESFLVDYMDGQLEGVEGSELFKDKRSVKFPSISADGSVLIFASKDIRGGYGGYDLYRMVYRSPFWSNPENLGPSINTPGDEIYPFISYDNKLYFSSNGLGGYGGLDVLSIDLSAIGEKDPNALEPPVNSKFDDYAYMINSKSGLGVYASNRNMKKDAEVYAFQRVFDNCGAEALYSEERNYVPCNDSAYCVDFDITGTAIPEGVPLECLWDMGDGHKRYGEKFKYCYRKPGLYKATLNVSVKNEKGVIEKNKFDVEIDLRNREALRLERYYYDDWLYLISKPYNCNGCQDMVYHWKWGDIFSCGDELRIKLDDPAKDVKCVMEYTINDEALEKACYITIKP